MRVSTGMIYQQGMEAMQRQQSQLLDTQQHIAAKKRVIKPSDDPVAASRAVETAQAQAMNAQYGSNQATAKAKLAMSESALGDVGNVLTEARTLMVNAGNGSLTDSDRKSLAVSLRSSLQQLMSLANTRDGAGGYLFGGFQDSVQPFTPTADGAAYNGDQGRQELQVGPSRSMAVGENGSELFERIRQGNGVFSTVSNAANTGTGQISVGRATTVPAAPVGNYQIAFTVSAGVSTYDVIDMTTSPSTMLSTGNAYTPGAAIVVGGMQMEISGAPANGDRFDIAPAANQNVFSMLSDAIDVLEAPSIGPADRARYDEGVGRALANIDQASEHVLTVRTAMGANLRELDALDATTQDQALQYATRMSDLVDLDYASALSDFAQQQTALEAAQLSYQRITSLSLFNYL
jgi:flagellar hook-associated protein 3 FlgL